MYLKLLLKLSFFNLLCYFSKNKSLLTCLETPFFRICRIFIFFPWKEIKKTCLVNLQTKKLCFLIKMKIRQNVACPNEEHNAIFVHIFQNIRTYFRNKKMHWSMIEKVLLHVGKNPSKVKQQRTSAVCFKYCLGSEGGSTSARICYFYSRLSLEIFLLNSNFSWKLAI